MEYPLNMYDLGAPTIGNLQVGGNLEVGAAKPKLAAKLAWPSTAKQSLLSSWGGWDLVDLGVPGAVSVQKVSKHGIDDPCPLQWTNMDRLILRLNMIFY